MGNPRRDGARSAHLATLDIIVPFVGVPLARPPTQPSPPTLNQRFGTCLFDQHSHKGAQCSATFLGALALIYCECCGIAAKREKKSSQQRFI